MIELRKIRHVIEIARLGGFAKASATLHITQSALTKSVQSVEDRLGLHLFERSPKGVRLTPEGEKFVLRGSRLLAGAEELENDARAVRNLESGRLRVGSAPAGLDILWLDVLPVFAGQYPGIRIETVADSVDQILHLLLHGELDLAVGTFGAARDNRDIVIQRLYTWPIQPFVRRGHPLDGPETPSAQALLAYPWVGQAVPEPHSTILRRLAVASRSRYEQPQVIVGSFEAQMRVVEKTDAVSTVFSHFASHRFFSERFRSWSDSTVLPPLEIDYAIRSGWQPTHAANKLLDLMKLHFD